MARQTRRTEPLGTRDGLLVRYEEIEPRLSAAEAKGRVLVFAWSRSSAGSLWTPTDADILDIHKGMFGEVFDWAGRPRTDARGPGGIERVPAHEVRVELRKLADDLRAWVAGDRERGEPDLGAISRVIADAHHRFQWIHPFPDTNGRTGRVFDHGLLWATYALSGETPENSPAIEYFPDAAAEDDYFDGLEEADLGRPERLRKFYETRLELALQR